MGRATSALGLVVLSAACFVIVQSFALWAKREHGDSAFGPAWGLGIGVIGLVATCCYFIWLHRFLRRRDVRLARSLSTEATVVSFRTMGKKGQDFYAEWPRLRYSDAQGKIREHESAVAAEGLSIGQIISVRFDPTGVPWVVPASHDHVGGNRSLRAIGAFLAAGSLINLGFAVYLGAGT